MTENRILGIGNALVDALVQVPDDAILNELNLPKGSMQLIDTDFYERLCQRLSSMEVKRATGGSACNTMLALAQMGAAPGLIGKISDDDNGRFFADSCTTNGIQAQLLPSELRTGVATTFITPGGCDDGRRPAPRDDGGLRLSVH